jgi:TonB family protein
MIPMVSPSTNKAMKLSKFVPTSISGLRLSVLLVSALLIVGSAVQLHAQSPQLSLADLLIGLRSKKASLPERNAILTEAVRQRGVTFAMTPEIEKELETTGASPALVEAIRQKIEASKPVAAVAKPVATPIPTPTPPDFSFYQTRADQNAGKGEFNLAVADYNKSLEMKADNAIAYLGRGKAHLNLKSYDLSVKDFDKALEINPKDTTAFLNRGVAFEKLGDLKRAMDDYQRATDIDPANETAKASLKRVQDAVAAANAAAAAEAARNAPPPEFVNVGILSSANAVRMVTPVYSVIAQRSLVEGRVIVDVDLDETGAVVSAKANSGHQMLRNSAEDAAKKSKFKPATYNNRPIKAKGQIVYNFSLKEPGRP